jgi:hypothetical protein
MWPLRLQKLRSLQFQQDWNYRQQHSASRRHRNEISELPEDKKLDFLFGLKGACIDLISFRVETFDIPDAKKDQCLAIQEKAEIIAGFAEPDNYNITKKMSMNFC